ncbi:MAG: hypothetical protein AB1894_00605 [Chloroflexota bacterium]
MEAVEVTARFDPTGKIFPQRLIWHGRTFDSIDTGRQWVEEDSYHILIMLPGEQVYELVFVPKELTWYLSRPGLERRRA